MQQLEELIRACPSHHRKLVVADSLFSMDGETRWLCLHWLKLNACAVDSLLCTSVSDGIPAAC